MRPSSSRVLRAAAILGFVAAYLGSSACGPAPPPAPKNEAWCNISAVPCAVYQFRDCCFGGVCDHSFCTGGFNDCIGDSSCALPNVCAGVLCDGNLEPPTSVVNPATCGTIAASVPTAGDRVCFTSGTPQAACTGLCSPFGSDLNTVNWPIDNNLRSRCSSTVVTDANIHPGLVNGQITNGCMDPAPPVGTFASQGTNMIALTGTGTVHVGGGPATSVSIVSGYFDIAAPKTDCTALQVSCPTQINQVQVNFADFTLDGHTISGLKIYLDAQVLTSSGVRSGDHFVFTIPQNTTFDAIATFDGSLTGTFVSSTQEVDGSIDLTTGELAFQFNVSGTFQGETLEASGVATSASVLALAPVVTVAPITPVDNPTDCIASVTVSASATSAAGLPVTIAYIVDGSVIGTGASATAALSIGKAHQVQVTGTDSNGMFTTVTETVTPTDALAPNISCPASQILECTDHGAVATFAANATDNCGVTSVVCTPPSGTKFPEAGSPTTDTCTATDSSGNLATCTFQVDVRDTLPPTVTISNDGSGYSGTQWPPNHGYVSHTLADCVTGPVVDQCDGTLGSIDALGKIVRITSDEPENDPGDGNTCADMVITGPSSFQLRSERSGQADGRVYTVEFTVADNDNNNAVKTCSFQVPHDQSGSAAVAGPAVYCVGTNCGGLPGNDPHCH